MKKNGEVSIFILTMMFVLACFELPTNYSAQDDTEEDLSPFPTLTIIDSKISPIDGMTQLLVPAGGFVMGSYEDPSNSGFPNVIFLDAFWIDQTEVNNGQYQECVAANTCTPPADLSSYEREQYYGNRQYDDFPVIHVSWFQAQEYCTWAGRRMPTEAEWEKAARGTDGQKYPWGEEYPDYSFLNFKGAYGQKNPLKGTTRVGSYPKGASPYGALDLAGNVFEWVTDWYDQFYFKTPPPDNPQGPPSGEQKVYRGGDWDTYDVVIQSSYRLSVYPEFLGGHIGFRCAQVETDS